MRTFVPEKPWQDLYKAALFETDKSKTAKRIADAERMILVRAQTLMNQPNNSCAERNSLAVALYALSVLKIYRRAEPHQLNEGEIPPNRRLRRSL